MREIYRILDAAANRGREALRVVEDAARFLGDNEQLATALKEARHRFAAAAEKLDRRERLLARDTPNDVGVDIETEDEYRRTTLQDVLTANFARLQESARSLEEFSKLVAPQIAREWERVRYDAYTLEKAVFESAFAKGNVEQAPQKEERPSSRTTSDDLTTNAAVARLGAMLGGERPRVDLGAIRRERLARCGMRVSVDRELSDEDALALFRSGVASFQFSSVDEETATQLLRQWNLAFDGVAASARPLLFAREPRVWSDEFDGIVVNLSDALIAREEFGADVLVGGKASTFEEVETALKLSALGALDFVDVGPVFAARLSGEPTSSVFLRSVGEAFAGRTTTPIFAFGGIDSDNSAEVFDAGIERIVVGTSILDAPDKLTAALRLQCLA